MIKSVITIIFLTALGGCRSSPLFNSSAAKEVMREGVVTATDGIDKSLDKQSDKLLVYLKTLKLDEISGKIGLSVDETKTLIVELQALTKESKDGLTDVLNEAKRISADVDTKQISVLISNLNELTQKLNTSAEKVPELLDNINSFVLDIKEITSGLKQVEDTKTPTWALLIGIAALVLVVGLVAFLIIKTFKGK